MPFDQSVGADSLPAGVGLVNQPPKHSAPVIKANIRSDGESSLSRERKAPPRCKPRSDDDRGGGDEHATALNILLFTDNSFIQDKQP